MRTGPLRCPTRSRASLLSDSASSVAPRTWEATPWSQRSARQLAPTRAAAADAAAVVTAAAKTRLSRNHRCPPQLPRLRKQRRRPVRASELRRVRPPPAGRVRRLMWRSKKRRNAQRTRPKCCQHDRHAGCMQRGEAWICFMNSPWHCRRKLASRDGDACGAVKLLKSCISGGTGCRM